MVLVEAVCPLAFELERLKDEWCYQQVGWQLELERIEVGRVLMLEQEQEQEQEGQAKGGPLASQMSPFGPLL